MLFLHSSEYGQRSQIMIVTERNGILEQSSGSYHKFGHGNHWHDPAPRRAGRSCTRGCRGLSDWCWLCRLGHPQRWRRFRSWEYDIVDELTLDRRASVRESVSGAIGERGLGLVRALVMSRREVAMISTEELWGIWTFVENQVRVSQMWMARVS